MNNKVKTLLKHCLTNNQFCRVKKAMRIHNINDVSTTDYILSNVDDIMALSLKNIADLLVKE